MSNSPTLNNLLRRLVPEPSPETDSLGRGSAAETGAPAQAPSGGRPALDDDFSTQASPQDTRYAAEGIRSASGEASKLPAFNLRRFAVSRELAHSMTVPQSDVGGAAKPTSLMTEQLHDGDANCIERATLWAGEGHNVVFLRDHANLDGDDAGHAVIRDPASGRVWDPADGKPPSNPAEWKHASVEDWRRHESAKPGQHGRYTVDAEIPAAAVHRVLKAPPGEARAAALEGIKQEDPAIGAKLEAVAESRYARINPEDVAVEMKGQAFALTKAVGARKAGDRLTVVAWDNAKSTVTVRSGGPGSPTFSVPKTALKPTRPSGSTLAPYSTGIASQAAAVEKTEKALADLLAKKAEYKSPRAKSIFAAEKTRLEGLLGRRREVLNRKLIQETMYNRFDPSIQKAVSDYNTRHGLKGKAALDPDLVKSMLFQESQLGTSGRHLEDPPSHPVKSRFNLGQVIDSSGLALMTKLEKDHPSLMGTNLPGMRADLEAAQRERAALQKKGGLTPAERTRLTELDGLSRQNWEAFIWSYRSGATGKRFGDVVNGYFGATTPPRNNDYDFWIDMTVMWLGEKHTSGRTWPETIRRYNGGGSAAARYRNEVVDRAAKAEAAQRAGTPFQPDGI